MHGDARLRDVMLAINVALRRYQPFHAPVPILYCVRGSSLGAPGGSVRLVVPAHEVEASPATTYLSGNHFTCVEPPHVSDVARFVLAEFARWRQ
jgi:hypothetical protein